MKGNIWVWVITVLVVIAGIAGIMMSRSSDKDRKAVFLTNGQVYFGKIKNANSQFVTLEDVYYLQQQELQLQSGNKLDTKQINIVKLGEELHGPQDSMQINRDHILFFESMKDEARISKAIQEFINSGASKATSTNAD